MKDGSIGSNRSAPLRGRSRRYVEDLLIGRAQGGRVVRSVSSAFVTAPILIDGARSADDRPAARAATAARSPGTSGA